MIGWKNQDKNALSVSSCSSSTIATNGWSADDDFLGHIEINRDHFKRYELNKEGSL